MAPEKHALLGPSSASRWTVCTRSARFTEDMPERPSAYAAEGTLAHAIGELKLRKLFLEKMGPRTYKKKLSELQEREQYNPEMESCTDFYRDYVNELFLGFPAKPYLAVEISVDFSRWVPEGFGTCDCLMIGGGVLHIIDYKHGKGVAVSAERNPQMLMYALGAVERYKMLYAVHTVRMSIVQPRITQNVSTWELSAAELLNWADTFLAPRAKLAWEGKGDFVPGEKQCKFCKAKYTCLARAEAFSRAAEDFGSPPPQKDTLTPEDIGAMLERMAGFEAWLADMREYAQQLILEGTRVPGFRVVAGRSVRSFTDQDAAFRAIVDAQLTTDEMLYVRKPLSLSEVEKLCGKKKFAEVCAPYIEKPLGKPALVTDSDPRMDYSSAAADFKKDEN